MFCEKKMPPFCHCYSDFLPIISCDCLQIVHKTCLKDLSLMVSENTLDERILEISCLCCQTTISDYLIVAAFGEDQFNKIKDDVLKQKRLKRQMEEDMNMAAIFQIEEEEKQEENQDHQS